MPILPYKGVWPKIANNVFIAPGAVVVGDVTLNEGVSVWYNAVLRGDSAPIVVGRHCNIQDNCTLHVDADAPLTLGEECTIGHNAVVHGATLGDRVLVGMHATILSHAHVASSTIIAANSLVSEHREIPGKVLALGVPVRIVRELSSTELNKLALSATHYVEIAAEHRASGTEHAANTTPIEQFDTLANTDGARPAD